MSATQVQVGSLLRDWRQRRRLSQLELALDADVSARHLSFVETGRSRPSASMVLHLAERLEVPLRERNRMLLAAGHAPAFQSHDLDEPPMAPVRAAIDLILEGHDPYPALVVDRAWEMIAANRAVSLLTADVAPHLLEPPVNVLRVSLHPEGVAPRIANLAEWRGHLLDRLRRQIALTGDAALVALLAELETYPAPPAPAHDPAQAIAVPLRLHGPRASSPSSRRSPRSGPRSRSPPRSSPSSRSSPPTTRPPPPCASTSDAYLGRNRHASLRASRCVGSTPNGGPDVPAHRPQARCHRHRRQRRRLPRRRRAAGGPARPGAGAAARHRGVPAAVLRRGLGRRGATAGLALGGARGDRDQRPLDGRLDRVPGRRPRGPDARSARSGS